jgi:hypothetical protein
MEERTIMDDSSDNEDDHDNDNDRPLTEEEQIAAAERRHLKIMSVLQQKKKLPSRTRNKTDLLVKKNPFKF